MNIFEINGYNLDEYQKEVVKLNNKNILVIAGAGTGKTLTIIGKIRYLIEINKISEEEILCISFTNDTVKSIKEKLNKYGYNIEVLTFHKLALKVLTSNNEKYEIVSQDYLNYVINEYFNSFVFQNKKQIKDILKYLKIKYINNNKTYKEILKTKAKEVEYLKFKIERFIKQFKNKNYDINKFYELFKKNNKFLKRRNILFLRITLNIYLLYQNELISSNKIDFEDMINYAIEKIDNVNLKYKYIIIDEYQDTSYIRYLLIKKIIDKTNAYILAVGDDYQSIYRFTGCNLDVFLSFENLFLNSTILKIVNTYRNNQELINVASSFIMKNKKQIKKDLVSKKHNDKPIKIFYFKNKVNDFIKLINKVYIDNNNDILILGRNNFDINKYINNDFILERDGTLIYKKNKDIKLRYLTVHKSKGLEANNVIIINMINSTYGFPSLKEEDKIINLINDTKDDFYLEEERRLFYVALTRTKNNCYIMTMKNKESIFIREIFKYNKEYIHIINCDSNE